MSIVADIKKARTPVARHPVIDLFNSRFSPRVYSSEAVKQEDLDSILEAARLAPSGRNKQPWFFYTVHSGTVEYEKLLGCVPDRNQWAKTAPVIIVACYDPNESAEVPNIWSQYDLGAAVFSLVLQASALGYRTRQIGSFEKDQVKQQFDIPDPNMPFILITLGKMGTEDDYLLASPEIIQKEIAANPKKDSVSAILHLKNV